MTTCPYVCNNKTEFGYCMSTACINPLYNQQSITKWLEKADYVQVVRCKDCKWWGDLDPKNRYTDCYCHVVECSTEPDWYCADGERKVDPT